MAAAASVQSSAWPGVFPDRGDRAHSAASAVERTGPVHGLPARLGDLAGGAAGALGALASLWPSTSAASDLVMPLVLAARR